MDPKSFHHKIKNHNPTFARESYHDNKLVKSIDLSPKTCEDCGDLVKNRVVSYRLYDWTKNRRSWRKSCSSCDKIWENNSLKPLTK